MENQRHKLTHGQDELFTYADCGRRWRCHPVTAKRRILEANLPVVHFNKRVHLVRLSDILRLEEEAN